MTINHEVPDLFMIMVINDLSMVADLLITTTARVVAVTRITRRDGALGDSSLPHLCGRTEQHRAARVRAAGGFWPRATDRVFMSAVDNRVVIRVGELFERACNRQSALD